MKKNQPESFKFRVKAMNISNREENLTFGLNSTFYNEIFVHHARLSLLFSIPFIAIVGFCCFSLGQRRQKSPNGQNKEMSNERSESSQKISKSKIFTAL